jgi:phosphohistidine swiveling domain-containing protein
MDLIKSNGQLYDKIEFDVAFTIWTPSFEAEAIERLGQRGFSQDEINRLSKALKRLTTSSLSRLEKDISPIAQLAHRRDRIISANNSAIDKFYELLDDCKQFGTLAFSHAARAGFVAATLLESFVKEGILSDCRRLELMRSVKTVARELEDDKAAYHNGFITLEQLLAKYGHLRTGTYEITSEAYWENPELYFSFSPVTPSEVHNNKFKLSSEEATAIADVLDKLDTKISPDELVEYIIKATESREWAKFEFTKNLSAALDQAAKLVCTLGIDRELISFLEYRDLEMFKLNLLGKEAIRNRACQQRENHKITQLVELPSLLLATDDFYAFEIHSSQPNFVTTKMVCALIVRLSEEPEADISNKILLIPQADPGYDWVFGKNIAGLITQYGGPNSHMAIRAAEFDLPVALGVGKKLYEEICSMRRIELDCANRTIRPL